MRWLPQPIKAKCAPCAPCRKCVASAVDNVEVTWPDGECFADTCPCVVEQEKKRTVATALAPRSGDGRDHRARILMLRYEMARLLARLDGIARILPYCSACGMS